MVVRSTKGQISMPFHWIYIIVAGAAILLFFIGFVTRQQGAAEQQLSLSVTQKLDGIFTGAALSEQTVNVIDVPQLEFFFTCDDEGISEYQVGKRGTPKSLSSQPFFAPNHLYTSQLVSWTLGFGMPYTVINLLLLGSPSVTTFLVYQDGDPLSIQLKDAIMEDLPPQFGIKALSASEFARIGGIKPPIKLIFLTRIEQDGPLPTFIENLHDDALTVLRVELTGCSVTYYKKNGNRLEPEGTISVMQCMGKKNPAFYAALFSDTSEAYRCGMAKAFRRMLILTDIYAKRAEQLKAGYTPADVCWFQVRPQVFQQLREHVAACSVDVAPGCLAGVAGAAAEIHTQNTALQNNNCATLY